MAVVGRANRVERRSGTGSKGSKAINKGSRAVGRGYSYGGP